MAKPSGFTIIELMLTITIAGILLAVALPNYQSLVKNNCLTTKANALVGSLQMARSEAIKVRQSMTVSAVTSGWKDGWQVKNPAGTVLRDVALSCPATTITEAGSAVSLTYTATGFINAPATFNICDERTAETGRQVLINTVGRPNTNSIYQCQ